MQLLFHYKHAVDNRSVYTLTYRVPVILHSHGLNHSIKQCYIATEINNNLFEKWMWVKCIIIHEYLQRTEIQDLNEIRKFYTIDLYVILSKTVYLNFFFFEF